MQFKKLIFSLLILLLSLAILLCGIYYVKTEASKLTFYTETGDSSYFLPNYSIEYFSNEASSQTYIRVSDIFVQTWSLRRFHVDHWWSGSISIWLKLEDGEIKEAFVRVNHGVVFTNDYVLFLSNDISGVVSSEKLKNVTFSTENDDEELSIHFSSLDLNKAEVNTDLERQYDLLVSDYFDLENPYLDAIQRVIAINQKNLLDDELVWLTKDYPEGNGIIVYTGPKNEYVFFVSGGEVFAISEDAKEVAPSADYYEGISVEGINLYLNPVEGSSK
ncbi:MAG: hypothetical protein WC653_01675 [Candidatus Gracilibacteria bacterium]